MRGLALLVLLFVAACGGPQSKCGPSSAKVDRVIDGDTIVLTDGTRIRYLLVNAPETTLGHNDCYGQEASNFNDMTVTGKTIELTYDTECTDKYGRTLAFVKVNGLDVNRALVDQGLACYDYIPPDGTARHQEFLDAQTVAKTNRVGMWGSCAVITCGG